MPNTGDQITNLDAELDALESTTTADTYAVTKDYDTDIVAASAVRRGGGGGGGGGAPSTLARGTFNSGLLQTIANNGLSVLEWADNGSDGGPVVDLSDPKFPAVIVAGVYTVAVWVSPTDMTAGGYFRIQLDLDFSGEGASGVAVDSRTAGSSDGGGAPRCLISDTYYIPAGGTIRLLVRNYDGADSRDFGIEVGNIQRVA